jgi:alpha-galactosidase
MSGSVRIALLLVSLLIFESLTAQDTTVGTLVVTDDFRLGEMTDVPRRETRYLTTTATHYAESNAIEWQVVLAAHHPLQQKVVDDVKSADFEVLFPTTDAIRLHWNKGSQAEATDFQPVVETLADGQGRTLQSNGGRSSDGVMPYFNLASDRGGLIIAIGWSGNWQATFTKSANHVRISAGLRHERVAVQDDQALHLPSILVMSYVGDWQAGQNQFRKLMRNRFTPHHHDPLQLMPVAASVHGIFSFNETTAHSLTALAQDIAALQLPIDTFWLDAGWNDGGFPLGQGNPNADPIRFPQGLEPVGEAVAATGIRFLAWFEPERVMRGTWLSDQHPSWLLQPTRTPAALRYLETDGFQLLDLGNPHARTWVTDEISNRIGRCKVDIFRQDFNASPEYFWHTDVEAPAAALREVRYINGLYRFLDDLSQRHPQLILDNCASGGRRLDFEMMRRCVALWRSDSCWDSPDYPRNVQAMSHGLSLWIPLHGLGAAATDQIALRSGMGACASFAINFRDPIAVDALQSHLDRYLPVRELFTRDYYPLSPWSLDPNQWLAFQFHDPDRGRGVVQAFCGNEKATSSIRLRLRGLDPDQRYLVNDWDHADQTTEIDGRELMKAGLEVHLDRRQAAIVLEYAATTAPD